MTLQSSGAISFSHINTELGLTSTSQLSLGGNAARTLAGVASGAISMSNLYGKSALAFTMQSTTGTMTGQVRPDGYGYGFSVAFTWVSGSGTVSPVLISWPAGMSSSTGSVSGSPISLSSASPSGTLTFTAAMPANTSAGTYTWQWQVGSQTFTLNVVLSAALESKTVTVGLQQLNTGTVWEPYYADYWGFDDSLGIIIGSMSPNTTTNLWVPAGRWGSIYYTEESGAGTGTLVLRVWSAVGYGATPNSGWTSMNIGGQIFNRASANYSASGVNQNPYGDGMASEKVVRCLERADLSCVLKKRFFDLTAPNEGT